MGERSLFRQTISPSTATGLGTGVFYLTNAGITIVSGGLGYKVNDLIGISGGTTLIPCRLRVRSADYKGSILAVDVNDNGNDSGAFTTTPANPVTTSDIALPLFGGSGGTTGSGATFNLNWVQGVPPKVTHVRVMAETSNVRYRLDGTPPTASTGELMIAKTAGTTDLLLEGGVMRSAQFIQVSTATMDVEYLRS